MAYESSSYRSTEASYNLPRISACRLRDVSQNKCQADMGDSAFPSISVRELESRDYNRENINSFSADVAILWSSVLI